ncbi:MAG: aromatic ring-hydroxylating dioxygenase subunit alpha [Myxococcales bacterium]|nr:aromatic ring-hydroxylating dioxygenase subunit alpha [Myxococcales bacterium]
MPTEERLVAPRAKGSSVARIPNAWYVACASSDLGRDKPISRTILGLPIVLFRGDGGAPGALLDRCPHRNVPLSLGRVTKQGRLECGYHGWRFDRGGRCLEVPSLCGPGEARSRDAEAFGCVERDGFVWVWPEVGVEPAGEPFRFPFLGKPGYTSVSEHVVAEASVHAVAENALDVPHTAFAHAGLFRSDDRARNRVEVIVRRWADRVEAEYVGEPRPEGLVGRVLSPKGGVVKHWDRFILPSIVQVEYELDAAHIQVSAALTPESDYRTHLYAVVSFKLPVPGWPLVPVLKPIAFAIFNQDAKILKRQTEVIHRFGGESYVSTEIDVLGPHILRLLRAAEQGKVDPSIDAEAPKEKRFQMDV